MSDYDVQEREHLEREHGLTLRSRSIWDARREHREYHEPRNELSLHIHHPAYRFESSKEGSAHD